MNANDVIEAYVSDVAAQLPRKDRNDVAFELRALLNEELQAKADAAGREADEDMATELVRAFGRPGDVAARYRAPLTIIDPADGRAFLRATIIGLVIVWVLGLVNVLMPPIDSGSALLNALGAWWVGTVIPSLWWPGLLVVCFGLSAWSRRKWPHTAEWTPRSGDRATSNRWGMAAALVAILAGLLLLIEPRWILDVVWGGHAAPAAYDALTYTESFRQRQAPFVFVLLLLNIPMMFTVIVNDRWSVMTRRNRGWLGLLVCAVLTWVVLDGPVLVAPASDRAAKFAMAAIVVMTLIGGGIKLYRSIRPAPDLD